MTNSRERRMETLKANNINTAKFFNLNMNIPVGANLEIKIDGVPYVINSSEDAIVKDIMDKGYVFNSRTDGRFVTAQMFRLINGSAFNNKTKKYEDGFDACLRLNYGYMYQFSMMVDEVHRLARMEKDNDPEFDRLSRFFTKEVVYQTCKHYICQLKKYIKNQPTRKCKGVPYAKLNKYGNVFIKDLQPLLYDKLEFNLAAIGDSGNYAELEKSLKSFVKIQCKLPYDTPKCSTFKDAFKGKGSYMTLLNICKFHNCVVRNYETKEILDRDGSVAYIESLLDEYDRAYWKFHELLKATIELNNFDLKKSIETTK